MKYHEKQSKQKQQLKAIIAVRGVWEEYPSDKRQAEAKITLLEFLSTLKSMQADEKPQADNYFSLYTTHINYLTWVYQELATRHYVNACHELEKLVHYLPVFQPQIYWNVIALLEEYVGDVCPGITSFPEGEMNEAGVKKSVIITLTIECDKQTEPFQISDRIATMIKPIMSLKGEEGYTELEDTPKEMAESEFYNKLHQHGNSLLQYSE